MIRAISGLSINALARLTKLKWHTIKSALQGEPITESSFKKITEFVKQLQEGKYTRLDVSTIRNLDGLPHDALASFMAIDQDTLRSALRGEPIDRSSYDRIMIFAAQFLSQGEDRQ
jgi:hypothetical protein